jgi:cytochrome c556
MRRRNWIFALGFGLSLSFAAPLVFAHGSATGVVKERMDMMKTMRDALKELRPMMDAAQVDRSLAEPLAAKIAALAPRIVDHFPKGSGMPPSEALPEVWEEWSDFTDAAKHGVEKANALVSAIQTGDGEQSLRAYARLAKACKDCHSDFKKD